MRDNLETHVAELRQIYKDKRDAMIETLEQGLKGTDASWFKPDGGFFLWVKLPTSTDQKKVFELANASGVGYVPTGLHARRRRGGVHPPGVQPGVAGGDPRGHTPALQGDHGGARLIHPCT